jgi:DNA-binding CsgD family transcriptional regulator
VRRGRPPYPDVLTPREWEVLSLIREGLTNDQISERLGISGSGARFHVAEILSKLGVESRKEAATWSAPRKPFAPFALGSLLMKSGAAAAVAVAVFAMILLGVGILTMNSRASSDDDSAAAPTPVHEQPQPPGLEADVAGVLVRIVNIEYSSTSTTLHLELRHPYLDTTRTGYLFLPTSNPNDVTSEGFQSVDRIQGALHRATGGIDRREMKLGAVEDVNREVAVEIKRLCLFQSADDPRCEWRDGPWRFAWVPATGPATPTPCGLPVGPARPAFLTPSYLPPGFARKEDEYRCGAGAITGLATHAFYQSAATVMIVQDLKPGYDLDAEMTKSPTQTRVAFGGGHAYRTQNDAGNKFSVTWSAGNNLIVYVTGTYVSFEEVLRVAESMR